MTPSAKILTAEEIQLLFSEGLTGLRQKNNKKTASNSVLAINLHQTPKNR